MINDLGFMKYVINYCSNMKFLLNKIGVETPFNGQIFCPFHDNYNTPAAKLYRDDTGYKIFCFSEHRIYTSYDIYRDLLKENIYVVFNSIWNNLTPGEQQYFKENYGELESEEITVPCLEAFDNFKYGKITYKELCDILAKSYN